MAAVGLVITNRYMVAVAGVGNLTNTVGGSPVTRLREVRHDERTSSSAGNGGFTGAFGVPILDGAGH